MVPKKTEKASRKKPAPSHARTGKKKPVPVAIQEANEAAENANIAVLHEKAMHEAYTQEPKIVVPDPDPQKWYQGVVVRGLTVKRHLVIVALLLSGCAHRHQAVPGVVSLGQTPAGTPITQPGPVKIPAGTPEGDNGYIGPHGGNPKARLGTAAGPAQVYSIGPCPPQISALATALANPNIITICQYSEPGLYPVFLFMCPNQGPLTPQSFPVPLGAACIVYDSGSVSSLVWSDGVHLWRLDGALIGNAQ